MRMRVAFDNVAFLTKALEVRAGFCVQKQWHDRDAVVERM